MSEEEKKQDELQERREARRKRRIRNQIMAYSVVLLAVVLVAVGILSLISAVSKMPKKPNNSSYEVVRSSERETESDEEPTETEPEETESSSEVEESSSEPESTETVVEDPYQKKLDEIVNAYIEAMPLEDKVAGLFMVTPEILTGVGPVTKAGPSTKDALGKYAVGGILYRSQNVKNTDSFSTMITNTLEYTRNPLFLAIEEEGGSVTQLSKANLGVKTDSAKKIAETGDVKNAYNAGAAIGGYLKDFGITINFAPVADLACIEKSVVAERSYGNDANTVYEFVKNAMNGMSDQGITPCVKHFPGMGSVTTDTEKGVAKSERSEADFWANELALYHKLVDDKVPMIMVSNMAAPNLVGDNTPCSLSDKVVTKILRQELGYDGLVITDALNEKAVSQYYSAEEASIMALKAGCDMILCPEDFKQAYEGVQKAVKEGTISEERVNDALRRIYRIKFADRVE